MHKESDAHDLKKKKILNTHSMKLIRWVLKLFNKLYIIGKLIYRRVRFILDIDRIF